MTNLTLRQTGLLVTVDGQQVPQVLSAQCSYGWDLRAAEARVVVRAAPSWAIPWKSVVSIWMAARPVSMSDAPRFVGFFVEEDDALDPHTVTLVCRGPLILADRFQQQNRAGVDLTNGGAGKTDQAMATQVLTTCGLPWGPFQFAGGGTGALGGTGVVLGSTAGIYKVDANGVYLGPFTWTVGQSGIQELEELEKVCAATDASGNWGAYRSFDNPGGIVFRAWVSESPASTAAVAFVEGVDIFNPGQQQKTTLEVKNRVSSVGFNYGGATGAVSYVSQQTSPYLVLPDGTAFYNTEDANSALLERSASADPGNGFACQDITLWRLSADNKYRHRQRFQTPRDDYLVIGQTIGVTSGRLGTDSGGTNYILQHVDVSVSERGAFRQDLVGLGGPGSAASVQSPPRAAFSLTVEQESVVVAGVETTIYGVSCQSTSAGLSGALSSYAWSATGGTPSTGSGASFFTTFPDLTARTIALAVTDANGNTNSITLAVPTASTTTVVRRELYLAGTGDVEDLDPGTFVWHVDTIAGATVATNGPVWGAGDTVVYTTDHGATWHTSQPKPGTSVTALWVETDISTSSVLAGLADGSVFVSHDGAATWTAAGVPEASAILRVVINRFAPLQWFALTASHYWQTTDGVTWTVLQTASGETFRDVAHSWDRGYMLVMSGGRLAIDSGGTTQTFPTNSGDIQAIAPTIDGGYVAYDSAGHTFVEASGATTFTAGAALPTGSGLVVQPRGLWRDGAIASLLYVAGGAGGVWKSVDRFATTGGYYKVRQPGVGTSPVGAVYLQVGADGLLSTSKLVSTIVVSDTTARAVSLWNGGANVSPALDPAGVDWTQPGYVETAPGSGHSWAAAVNEGAGGLNAPPSGSTAIWATLTPASNTEQVLTRQPFSLGSGSIGTATITLRADEVMEVWINGVYVTSHGAASGSGISPEATYTVDPTILLPGASNLIAALGKNFNPAGAYLAYKLVVN